MILVVDMNRKKDSLGYYEFVLPILTIIKQFDKWSVEHYKDVTHDDLNRSDLVILSGTPLKDTATLTEPEKFQWLKETQKPILGICAGMETIGVVYGMRLRPCTEIGMTSVDTVKDDRLMRGALKAYSLHSYCVEPSEEFEVLARSQECIQVIKHKTKMTYGVLFHPEVRNPEVIERFVHLKA